MIATSEDVARRAGVSRATVSQILNGRGQRFATETRERVTRAATELGYQPSAAGRTLAKGSSDIVIAVIPYTTFGGNLQDIFQAATEELASRGLTLLLHLATESTAPLDRVVTGMKPRAVISLTPFSRAELDLLKSRGVMAFDPDSSSKDRIDPNVEIGALQARHLADRGFTRLVFAHLQDARLDPFGEGREAGVRRVCAERGLPEPVIVRLGIDPHDALEAIDSLELPGAGIVCYNDDVATALLSAATIRGWAVPADVGFVGMDHTPLSAVTIPPLSTVGYDQRAAAYNLITAALQGLGESTDDRELMDVKFALVPRGTA
ncbi:LacI family DNA-binding transcriptional regulator [Agromyces sp. Marseille-Q5079]|uniref:LacI family DNA-binding transcriptional regulator n=1 Tax=Agromyces sp. Marseille-Q5079 TaxID=3439059 RepID=UPI003D9CB424